MRAAVRLTEALGLGETDVRDKGTGAGTSRQRQRDRRTETAWGSTEESQAQLMQPNREGHRDTLRDRQTTVDRQLDPQIDEPTEQIQRQGR